METKQFELYIREDVIRFKVDIFCIVRKCGQEYNCHFDSDGLMFETFIENHLNSDFKPLLSLPYTFFKPFIKEVADYADNQGISVENTMKGKLEILNKDNEWFKQMIEKVISNGKRKIGKRYN
jgi:hypothetical protein